MRGGGLAGARDVDPEDFDRDVDDLGRGPPPGSIGECRVGKYGVRTGKMSTG